MSDIGNVILRLAQAFNSFCPPAILYLASGFTAFYALFKIMREVR